ncbi:hypothetical protein Bmeg_00799 [Bacillus megaterium]|uniref:Uncharacterized protein n=1 Tax=Priestia megaterium (strain ATCC 12872 / QMB1551) TaxID=545693 RepID=D5DU35_PRIM1|nr:conserved hypothetical protein [Priestia megaterium QM B1551]MUL29746.1 hypothetical protein [Priestia megaterium]
MLEPTYAENVIVGVIHKKQFQWYVTDRELWYLDYVKFAQAFESHLAADEYIEPERKGIEVLSSENAELFLQRIESYKADTATLLKLFEDKIESKDEEDVLDFSPSFLMTLMKKRSTHCFLNRFHLKNMFQAIGKERMKTLQV